MIKTFISKIFGDPHSRTLRKLQPILDKINSLEKQYEGFTDEELRGKTEEFKQLLHSGKTLDDILPDAFAIVREASKRALSMRPFDVQILGGIVLHQGKITEMKTGEGKTLVATLPTYLNALTGHGVHVVTVNDYLAKRDGTEMGVLYEFLGLKTKYIIHGQSPQERKECYAADVVYATNNELGFDYLRDNMAVSKEHIVQKKLAFCIIDEVDSILIDEARTPLIISAPAEESTSKYQKYASLIPRLSENIHYTLDEKSRSVLMTDEGVSKMEELLGMSNIYTEAGFTEVHHIEQALKAHALFKRDIDYVIKDGEIVIVDEFTGRLMPGRRYSDGLHQAIEAKEDVEIKRESKTLASITFQNYFRLYEKLSGMTGTAATEAEEFYQIYGADTVVIPTNKPLIREDRTDNIYKTAKGRYEALTKVVKEKYEKGQPVLVGTASIDTSEVISKYFEKVNIPHRVLNAKYHEKEAEIIARAGQKGAITIATNMAGRGTDIKLGEGVAEVGGLCVIGSERHEARRIDDQLRGRSGRQGDPGESQFFVSMEDDLMRLFGGDRIKNMMNMLKVPEDVPINNNMISSSIRNAQKKIEGMNFDTRKHVLEYDDVLNKQRTAVYKRRRHVLESESVSDRILEMFTPEAEAVVDGHLDASTHQYNIEEIGNMIKRMTGESFSVPKESKKEDIVSQIVKHFEKVYNDKKNSAPTKEAFFQVEKAVYLRTIDTLWMDHLDQMTNLRNDVSLYGYGQRNPLIEYKKEGYHMYMRMVEKVQTGVLSTLFHIAFQQVPQIQQSRPLHMQTNEDQIEGNISKPSPRNIKSQAQMIAMGHQTAQGSEKVNRNDPCPCGSGKKYKKCCGR